MKRKVFEFCSILTLIVGISTTIFGISYGIYEISVAAKNNDKRPPGKSCTIGVSENCNGYSINTVCDKEEEFFLVEYRDEEEQIEHEFSFILSNKSFDEQSRIYGEDEVKKLTPSWCLRQKTEKLFHLMNMESIYLKAIRILLFRFPTRMIPSRN